MSSHSACRLGTQLVRTVIASSSRSVSTLVARSTPVHARNALASSSHERRSLFTESTSSSSSARPISIGNLSPLESKRQKKRLGRGTGSGKGKTSGRGHKGQKSRAGNGKPKPGFEGGQTPITRRFPKRGFTNHFAKTYVTVNVGRIQEWIDDGRLDVSRPITARELYESACIHSHKDGVKVLFSNSGVLRSPIHLVVSRATPKAIEAVEQAGGSIVCKYYTHTSLRALVKPHKYVGRLPVREPDPVQQKDLLYYASKANRGYLSDRNVVHRRVVAAKITSSM